MYLISRPKISEALRQILPRKRRGGHLRSRKIAEQVIGTDDFLQMTSTPPVSITLRTFLVVAWQISTGAGGALLVAGIETYARDRLAL